MLASALGRVLPAAAPAPLLLPRAPPRLQSAPLALPLLQLPRLPFRPPPHPPRFRHPPSLLELVLEASLPPHPPTPPRWSQPERLRRQHSALVRVRHQPQSPRQRPPLQPWLLLASRLAPVLQTRRLLRCRHRHQPASALGRRQRFRRFRPSLARPPLPNQPCLRQPRPPPSCLVRVPRWQPPQLPQHLVQRPPQPPPSLAPLPRRRQLLRPPLEAWPQ